MRLPKAISIFLVASALTGCAIPSSSGEKSLERVPTVVTREKTFGERYVEWSNHARVCAENAIVGTFGLAVGRMDLFTEPLCRRNIPEEKPAASP